MDQKQPIRLFKPGQFTSNEGTPVSFSLDDLSASAAAFDPQNDPAPLVIGHPKLDDPAWGWVGKLSVQNGELVAEPSDVEPAFAELVKAKRYARVSAQFYPPEHSSNPRPGVWYLKHIGFLGAAAPALKGLGTVQFADGAADGLATFDFQTPKEQSMTKDQEASFAEREQALSERETAIANREKATEEAARKARHDANVSFAEGLVTAAKLAPVGKALVVGVLDHLASTDVVSFAEAGDMTPAAAFKKLFDGAQPLVDVAERGKKPGAGKPFASFAAPQGYQADDTHADLYRRAKVIQAEHPDLAWMDCVARAEAA